MKRYVLRLVALGALLLGSGPAEAAFIEGSTTGVFNNPVGAGGTGYNTASLVLGRPAGTTVPSTLDFGAATLSGGSGDPFQIGTLTFHNGAVAIGSSPTGFNLVTTIVFSAPSGTTTTVTVPIALEVTSNTGGAVASADSLTITLPATQTFTAGGYDYQIQVTGFGTISGDAFGTATSFSVYEDTDPGHTGTGTAALMATISATPVAPVSAVPAPAGAVLLGSGMVWLGLFRMVRRKLAPAM